MDTTDIMDITDLTDTSTSKTASPVFLSGVLNALSHAFYLPRENECFLLAISEDGRSTETIVRVPLHKAQQLHFLLLDNQKCFLGRRIELMGPLRPCSGPLSVAQARKAEGHFYVVSSKCQLHFSPVEDQVHEPVNVSGRLIEGVVTCDDEADSGVVILNKKILLVTVALAHISNVWKLTKGQVVLVANGHLVKEEGKLGQSSFVSILVACARSLVTVKSEKYQSLRESNARHDFHQSQVVDLAHTFDCDYGTVLALLRGRHKLKEKFDALNLPFDMKSLFEKVVCLALSAESESTLELPPSTSTRSAVVEFYDHGDECAAMKKTKYLTKVKDLTCCVDDLKRNLSLLMEPLKGEALERSNGKSSMCRQEFSRYPLLGVICANVRSGHMELKDASGSIILCLSEQQETHLVNKLVVVKEFTCVLEWFSGRQRMYLMINKSQVMADCASPPEETNEQRYQWKVMHSSAPLVSVTSSSACVAINIREVKDRSDEDLPARERIVSVSLAYLKGLRVLPIGTELNLLSNDVDVLQARNKRNGQEGNERHPVEFRLPCRTPTSDAHELLDVYHIPAQEPTAVEAVIKTHFFEENKYPGRFTSNTFDDNDLDQWLLPSSMMLHLRLVDEEEINNDSTVSVYCSNLFVPLGLMVGSKVRLENVRKVISKKGNTYFVSGQFTKIQYLGRIVQTEESQDISKTSFLRDIVQQRRNHGTFWCYLIVESFIKVSVWFNCPGCNHRLSKGGNCTFVGCHFLPAPGSLPGISAGKAVVNISDGSGEAQLIIEDVDHIRIMLGMTRSEWSRLCDRGGREGGELLYLAESKNAAKRTSISECDTGDLSQLFKLRCELMPETGYTVLKCKVRPFRDQEEGQLKLFCIKVNSVR